MDWVDIVIVALVVVAAVRGWFQGAIRQVLGWIGFIAGFYIGISIAPSLSSDVTHAGWRPVLALAIVVVVAFIGSFGGHLLGSVVRKTIDMVKLGLIDSMAGVVVGAAGVLVTVWLVAALLVSTSWSSVAVGIQGSRIINALDKALPTVPSAEAKLQTLIRNADLPNVFTSIVSPTVPKSVPPSELGPSVTGLKDPNNILKILATGCALEHQGTAFFVTPHIAVTNAHVVAGATHVMVGGATAQVALFDPVNDIAILRVPSLSEAVLRFAHLVPPAATMAHIIGFPLNGSRTGTPGFVNGEITAQSRDIYNQKVFARSLLVLTAVVEPGNSGSPVLIADKSVAGVIVSKSTSQPDTAYAIPVATVARDVAQTPTTGTQSTQSCVR
ncbi:MAG: MarP family serine protease [Acidimicrobiales bacterium]